MLFRATARHLRKIRLIAPRSLTAASPRDAQWWARWPARRGRERCGDGTGALDVEEKERLQMMAKSELRGNMR